MSMVSRGAPSAAPSCSAGVLSQLRGVSSTGCGGAPLAARASSGGCGGPRPPAPHGMALDGKGEWAGGDGARRRTAGAASARDGLRRWGGAGVSAKGWGPHEHEG